MILPYLSTDIASYSTPNFFSSCKVSKIAGCSILDVMTWFLVFPIIENNIWLFDSVPPLVNRI